MHRLCPQYTGKARLLHLHTPGEGAVAAADVLPDSVASAAAGINWTNILLIGGAAILIIGGVRFGLRKVFGNR